MELAQRAQQSDAGFAIAPRGLVSHGDKLVSDFGHGADHHHGRLLAAAGYNLGDALDGLGAFNRSAAKLHHNHARTAGDNSALIMTFFFQSSSIPILRSR